MLSSPAVGLLNPTHLLSYSSKPAAGSFVLNQEIRAFLGKPELKLNTSEPLICDYYTRLNLVTTIPSLADPLNLSLIHI